MISPFRPGSGNGSNTIICTVTNEPVEVSSVQDVMELGKAPSEMLLRLLGEDRNVLDSEYVSESWNCYNLYFFFNLRGLYSYLSTCNV